MIIIVISNIARIALYAQIGSVVGVVGTYVNAGNCYRFGVAYIVQNLQFVAVSFLNFQVVDVTIFIKVEVVDAVCRVVNGFFKGSRVGTGFYKLCQFIYIKTFGGIILNGYIVLFPAVLVARRGHKN